MDRVMRMRLRAGNTGLTPQRALQAFETHPAWFAWPVDWLPFCVGQPGLRLGVVHAEHIVHIARQLRVRQQRSGRGQQEEGDDRRIIGIRQVRLHEWQAEGLITWLGHVDDMARQFQFEAMGRLLQQAG